MTDPASILDLLSRRAWPAVAAVVLLALARAAKEPALGSPFARVPVRWRPHVVLVLGVLSGAVEAVVRGTPWGDALLAGVLSAACAIALHGWAGGVNPRQAAAPAQSSSTAPARVEVEATTADLPKASWSGERPSAGSAPARSPVVEPSTSWGPAPSGGGGS